ncbi:hypothetical protein FB107DRAFT_251571 [Schizophyllum commune]
MEKQQRAPSTPVSSGSRTTTKGQDGHTTTTTPCRPPRSIVVQPSPSPPLLRHNYDTNDGPRKSEYSRGVVIPSARETATLQNYRGTSTATFLSTYPSHPDAGGALPRVTKNSDTGQAAARANNSITNISVSPHPPRAAPEQPPLPSRYCPSPWKPAPSKQLTSTPPHLTSFDVWVPPYRPIRSSARDSDVRAAHPPTEMYDGCSGIGRRASTHPAHTAPLLPASTTEQRSSDACPDRLALLATAKSREKYTSPDDFRLAGAPTQEREDGLGHAHRAASGADWARLVTSAAALPHSQRLTPSPPPLSAHPASLAPPAPLLYTPPIQQVLIHATKHPPLPLPPSPLQRPPPPSPPMPPNWPFPLSVVEMGWVLTAVVMAQQMAREEEQDRDYEYEDNNIFDPYEVDRDNDPSTLIESSPQSPYNNSLIRHDFDFDNAIPRDWHEYEHTDDSDSLASLVSPPAVSVILEYSDVDSQDWGELSAPPYDVSREEFVDFDGSEEYRAD